MRKKILMSLLTIVAVVGATLGATVAYFSDTETSTGNVFAAGSIDLKVDNECYRNGEQVSDCTWLEKKDLTNELFFNFTDIKPSEWGEDTVSLHVYNNDAWAWLKIYAIDNDENGCSEPESEVDSTCGDGEGDGELAQNMEFLIWMDTDGDNQYDTGEPKIHEGTLEPYLTDACVVWPLDGDTSTHCDFSTGNSCDPLTGSQDYYVGIKWCFGQFDGDYDCNGSPVGNEVQTDSLSMNIAFTAVQSQNNPSAQGGPTCD